jgi:hypothetical protein
MSRRQCQNCRHFVRAPGELTGECRIRSVPQNEFPRRSAAEDCGEWQDGRFLPEQHERRELVRQFAVAMVAAGSQEMVHQVWQRAAELADYEGQK